MPNEINIYEPRTLQGIIDRKPPVYTFFKSTFFKRTEGFLTESFDVDIKKGGRALAPFIHPVLGGKVIKNEGYQTKSYKAPLVAPEKVYTAADFNSRLAGEPLYDGYTPSERAIKFASSALGDLDEMITRREEYMCASALYSGSLTIKGDGVNEVIDFGFTNKETLTGTKKWGGNACDIMGDLRRWRKKIMRDGFVSPDVCILSEEAYVQLLADSTIRELLDNRRLDYGILAPKVLPNGVTYIGRLNELALDLYTVTEYYLDDFTSPENPETKSLVPAGSVLMISSNSDYVMNYGAITHIPDGGEQFVTVEGIRVADNYVYRNPDRIAIKLSSCPLPVPNELESWFVATVV